MNCIEAWLYLDIGLVYFQFFPLLASSLKSIPSAPVFVSSGVQNRSNAKASDHLIRAERSFILWFQNRERTNISCHGFLTQSNKVSNNLKFRIGIMKKSKHLRAILA